MLLGQPEEFNYGRFLRGLLDEAFKKNFDDCVFSMFIKYQHTPARCVGEPSIFGLVSYDKFDAIIVMADAIQTNGVIERIEEDLHRNYKGKCFSSIRRASIFRPFILTIICRRRQSLRILLKNTA